MGKCGKKCEVFSRVVGYMRPINTWNNGKQSEWEDRVEYDVEKSFKSKYAQKQPISHKSGQTELK